MKVSYKLVLAGVAAVLVAGCSNSGAPNVPQVAGGAAHFQGPSPNIARLQSWRAAIAHAPTPGNGCYTAAYPLTTWIKVACVAAPNRPYIPRTGTGGGLTVGDGNDYAAVTSTLTSNAVGSFPKVKHLISESDEGEANVYSIQLNSNFMIGRRGLRGREQPGPVPRLATVRLFQQRERSVHAVLADPLYGRRRPLPGRLELIQQRLL